MNTGPGDVFDVTARLCVELPRLAPQARRHQWAHKLNAALTDIRGGKPVAQALADHEVALDSAAARREQADIRGGNPAVLSGLGIDPVDVTGDYICPGALPCSRRADRGRDGREPRCGVYGRTMILNSQ